MSERAPGQRERVAERVSNLLASLAVVAVLEGVQPLNPGHFELERIRTEPRPKECNEVRQKLRSGDR